MSADLIKAGICGYGHTIRGLEDTVLRRAGRCCRACQALANAEARAASKRDDRREWLARRRAG